MMDLSVGSRGGKVVIFTAVFGLLALSKVPVFFASDGKSLRRYGAGREETPMPLWLAALLLTASVTRA